MQTRNEKIQYEKLIELIKQCIAKDKQLREEFKIEDKFRFIKDRLDALLQELEASLNHLSAEEKKLEVEPEIKAIHDAKVYVYLFNANGITLKTWINMLTPKVFYEYSVNRPIYAEKKHIESLIRSKANKMQHGYLTISVKKSDILSEHVANDTLGNPLLKVKEGCLHIHFLEAFTHNENDYVLNAEGSLVKKE